jgi:hypothetical protein
MLGNLVFAWWGGSRFDEDVKFWRLFADVINDVSMLCPLYSTQCLELVKGSVILGSLCACARWG